MLSRKVTATRGVLLSILGVLAGVRAASPLDTTIVLGHSMEPTLHSGTICALDRRYYRSHALSRGDVIVLRIDGRAYIKRVRALPGERLWMLRYDDRVGNDLMEPAQAARICRFFPNRELPGCRLQKLTIPRDYCFVLGDNGEVSMDSRDFGPVPVGDILGRAIL